MAGTVTELASGDSGIAVNDVLMFEIRDATKKLYKNGSEELSTTDNALTSAGKAGVGLGNLFISNNDIALEWQLDDFKVTDLALDLGPFARRITPTPF